MTSRGRARSRSTGDQSDHIIPLTSKVSKSRHWADEEIDPDSDAAFLRRHRSSDRDSSDSEDRVAKSGFFQRLVILMSKSPLLRGFSSASYGALRNRRSRSQSEDGHLANDRDTRKRGRRGGKSSALNSAASFASFGSQRRRHDSASHSRSRVRSANLRGFSPTLIPEPGHPAGQGGHLGSGLPFAATNGDGDEGDEVLSIDEDEDILDTPDNSPYPQVRASVAATDDISASINTPRMWILSLLCALLGSATNLFFSLRYPSVAITPVIALVVVHPLGRAWDRLLKRPDDPKEIFEFGNKVGIVKLQDPVLRRSRVSRLRLWLAQGRWNGKEHACVSRFLIHPSLFDVTSWTSVPRLALEILDSTSNSPSSVRVLWGVISSGVNSIGVSPYGDEVLKVEFERLRARFP